MSTPVPPSLSNLETGSSVSYFCRLDFMFRSSIVVELSVPNLKVAIFRYSRTDEDLQDGEVASKIQCFYLVTVVVPLGRSVPYSFLNQDSVKGHRGVQPTHLNPFTGRFRLRNEGGDTPFSLLRMLS